MDDLDEVETMSQVGRVRKELRDDLARLTADCTSGQCDQNAYHRICGEIGTVRKYLDFIHEMLTGKATQKPEKRDLPYADL